MAEISPARNTSRIEAALKHLAMGFAAFSVWSTTSDGTCKCPKGAQCTSPGKHPITQNGFLDATTDPVRLRTMLSAGSEPNYGIVVPETGDVIIIDVDGEHWRDQISALRVQFGALPATKTTRTPSGGLHLFYRWPADVPMPASADFHGFVCRYPWKGYVVGPGSQIGESVYEEVGPPGVATLPLSWVEAPTKTPLIVVKDAPAAYTMPDSVDTGHRHEEIARLVASYWNRRVPFDTIEREARVLAGRFVEPMDEARLTYEIAESYRTAEKKWVEPAGGTGSNATSSGASATEIPSSHGRDVIEVGLLDAPVTTPPISMRREAFTTSAQIAELMDHWDPRTDASYESLLVQTLVTAGALMGHGPAAFYGSREQHANVFAVLVGTTGVSHKGTSAALVRDVWKQVTDAANGLSASPNSGEGVIALAAKRNGDPILVYEEEFARFLTSKGRDTSTLSPIMRQAFDDVALSSYTATRQVRADSHHIAMIGHITDDELADSFGGTDLKNGFANRIAWIGTFPRPVAVSAHDNALGMNLRDDLRAMIAWVDGIPTPLIGGTTHQMDPVARALLADAGQTYNTGVGLAPYLCRRLDSIAARLSLVYACFDHSRVIEPIHVEAALAVTDYARDSAAWLWPATTGDARADFVLRHLRDQGSGGFLDDAEIRALIGHRPMDKQEVADKLQTMGYARKATRPRRDGKAGRPRSGIELI